MTKKEFIESLKKFSQAIDEADTAQFIIVNKHGVRLFDNTFKSWDHADQFLTMKLDSDHSVNRDHFYIIRNL